jgi:hypothetical protein
MKDFSLNSFHFALIDKGTSEFRFKIDSEHEFLRVEVGDKDSILALIDKGVLLRNHIVKHTRNNYVYYLPHINLEKDGIFVTMFRRRFEEENIYKSLSMQKIALSAYSLKKTKTETIDGNFSATGLVELESIPLRPRSEGTGLRNRSIPANISFSGIAIPVLNEAPLPRREEYPNENILGTTLARRLDLYEHELLTRVGASNRLRCARAYRAHVEAHMLGLAPRDPKLSLLTGLRERISRLILQIEGMEASRSGNALQFSSLLSQEFLSSNEYVPIARPNSPTPVQSSDEDDVD